MSSNALKPLKLYLSTWLLKMGTDETNCLTIYPTYVLPAFKNIRILFHLNILMKINQYNLLKQELRSHLQAVLLIY